LVFFGGSRSIIAALIGMQFGPLCQKLGDCCGQAIDRLAVREPLNDTPEAEYLLIDLIALFAHGRLVAGASASLRSIRRID
jgi:hypothetical protein